MKRGTIIILFFILAASVVYAAGYSYNPISCTDSDGLNISNKGQVSYVYNLSGIIYAYNYTDSCSLDNSGVYEYFCSGNYAQAKFYKCQYGCKNGACINYGKIFCNETDGGQNVNVSGTANNYTASFYDNCINNKTLREYYCNNGSINYFDYNCGYAWGCYSGSCRPDYTLPKCEDSDGLDYYVFGKTSYYYSYLYSGSWRTYSYNYSDFCYNNTIIYEYYCQANSIRVSSYKCPDGCLNGACVKKNPVEFCNDSDGGLNYYMKGKTINSTSSSEDVCLSGKTLKEYYCLNNKTTEFQFNCPYACIEGACVNQTNLTIKVIRPPAYVQTAFLPVFLNITLWTNQISECFYSILPFGSNLTLRYNLMMYTNSTIHFTPITVNQTGNYWLDTLCMWGPNSGTNRTFFSVVQ
ncbi:hypothetical protein FJZ19_03870 [Candidatus Pacearchaeota archaeon]|nr:hypothetical protein [Candidatus Pacearchaeota archaeon]